MSAIPPRFRQIDVLRRVERVKLVAGTLLASHAFAIRSLANLPRPIHQVQGSIPCRFQCLRLPSRVSKSVSMRCRPFSTKPRLMRPPRKSTRSASSYASIPEHVDLARQVQVAADNAKNGSARLAGVEPPRYEDNETTIDQLKARLAKTVAYLKTLDRREINSSADREITFPLGPTNKGHMKATITSTIPCCRTSISMSRPLMQLCVITASTSARATILVRSP